MPSGGGTNHVPAPVDGIHIDSSNDSEDPTTLPGYIHVPADCPAWKKAMLERKNNELLEKAKAQIAEQQQEEAKWQGIPEWKKKLIQGKQQKKAEDENEDQIKKMEEEARFAQLPKWKQDILLKKKQAEGN